MNDNVLTPILNAIKYTWETHRGWFLLVINALVLLWIGPDLISSKSDIGVMLGIGILFGIAYLNFIHFKAVGLFDAAINNKN